MTRQVGDAKAVADLFAGVGPFALRLAERARVVAVELDAAAATALRQAADKTRGLKPVTVERRDLFRRPMLAREIGRVRRRDLQSAAPGCRRADARTGGERSSRRCGCLVQSPCVPKTQVRTYWWCSPPTSA